MGSFSRRMIYHPRKLKKKLKKNIIITFTVNLNELSLTNSVLTQKKVGKIDK